MKKYSLFLLSLALIIADQITKFFFQEKYFIFNSFFSFYYTENTGAAFSIFQGHNFILALISIIALALILFSFKKYPLALSFLFAGIIGNLIDRILFGYVRDFISVSIWPIFNLADTWNVIGVSLLIIEFLKEEKLIKLSSSKKS